MKKHLSAILLFSSIGLQPFAQDLIVNKAGTQKFSYEAGVSFGIMNAITDVGQKKGTWLSPLYHDWSLTKSNVGLYGELVYKNVIGARLEFTSGTIAADDAHSNSKHVQTRNLNFSSHIYEAALVTSFYPMNIINKNSKKASSISPYLMGGVSYFAFYPKALCGSRWVPLRPLHTEGQNSKMYPDRKEYDIRSLAIPFGIGAKMQLSPRYNFRLEALYRHTFTDYLDDVSTTYVDADVIAKTVRKVNCEDAVQIAHMYRLTKPHVDKTGKARGNPDTNDKFFSINLKVGYIIK